MFDLLFGWRKASKCKKLLKRVQCRLKLLKNKRSYIVKQQRDDVVNLLEHGHLQSAFQRVEMLIMDENMVQVYDLLDQFCEFIVINLPYIRKHRDCPNDINEAASTLIFSSARFGELPELLSIRKLFAKRYGHQFTTTALELLPGNLVNNEIKENLYMKTVPDDVKYRTLKEIAPNDVNPEPLLLEYKPALQEHEMIIADLPFSGYNSDQFGRKWDIESDSSLEDPSKLPEEVIYLDDIEEFASENGQRLFMFRSFSREKEMSLSRSSRRARRAGRRSSRRNRDITDIECAIYYGESRRPKNEQNGKRDDGLELTKALTMPSTRLKESSLKDEIDRSNPFEQSCGGYSSCSHIHPKLPDYDELAAKFVELKRANLEKQQKLSNLQE